MNTAANGSGTRTSFLARAGFASPLVLLAMAVLIVAVLSAIPLVLPIGSMYWDVFVYYDAANRIASGQVPVTDFFTPVGPLGYYLFSGFLAVFPSAHPTLIAHWSLLSVTVPLMALILWDVDRRSRLTALGLVVPFLIFALLPFNTREFYPFPGSDGFGIYNRHASQLIYVLVTALVFVQQRKLLTAIVITTMAALFFLKITGFVAGGLIAAFALLAGRLPLRHALVSAGIFLAMLALVEIPTGMVSRYIIDIAILISLNSETIGPRFFQAASNGFSIIAPAAILAAVLIWADRETLKRDFVSGWRNRSASELAIVINRGPFWLIAMIASGILFETQNTGSQAFIFIWPVVLGILLHTPALLPKPKLFVTVFALAAAIALPPMVKVVERAARTYIGTVKNVALESPNLGPLGTVSMRAGVAKRVDDMLRFYPQHRQLYDELVEAGELPTPIFYSDFDFQIIYLATTSRAVESIRALEAAKGVRFGTMMSLNFVNPFPYLMDRLAPRHIAIGADPTRAVPPPGSQEDRAVADTDIVLYPTCPPTTSNAELYKLYEKPLVGHLRIKLDDCYDAFVHPKFAAALGLGGAAPAGQ